MRKETRERQGDAPEERIRLLIVIPTLEIGGAERQITLLLKRLDRSRYDLALACCRFRGHLAADVPEDVSVYDLGKKTRWDFPLLIVRLGRVLSSFQPQIVLASLEYGVLLAWLANEFAGKRAQIVARKEVMPSQSRLGERMRTPKLWLDRYVRRRVRMIIAPSAGILDELRPSLSNDGIPLVQIVNAVDLDRLSRGANRNGIPRTSGRKVIVGMGRMVPWKGFEVLLRAIALLPKDQFELRLIGDGPERGRLESMAEALDLGAVVHFLGYRADPFPFLEGADLGVLPSEFEPFGNVIIEMFAAGLPVVAFDVDYGPREIIRDGENGLLVRNMNPESLAGAIETILANRELNAEMAARARKDAEELYSIGRVIARYEECFNYLAGKKATPPEALAS
jgi:glycosyltransferase involved in cell wall biosynthesis